MSLLLTLAEARSEEYLPVMWQNLSNYVYYVKFPKYKGGYFDFFIKVHE